MVESNVARRLFLKRGLLAGAWLSVPRSLYALAGKNEVSLTILHTNDTHSRIEPYPMNGPNAGLGGIAARKRLIDAIRAKEDHVLLLDAGDIFQGTPYFNFFKGALEMKAMQWMGYDATAMGNHDFDEGVENFARQMEHIRFPVLASNYDLSETVLDGKVKSNHILHKGGLKIGLFGLGIDPAGLIPDKLFGKTKYLDPLETAKAQVKYLREEQNCDLVICLSHLGHRYQDTIKPSDMRLASEVPGIDVVIGGHTHTFLDEPVKLSHKDGRQTLVCQVGHSGIRLGRIDLRFHVQRKMWWVYRCSAEPIR